MGRSMENSATPAPPVVRMGILHDGSHDNLVVLPPHRAPADVIAAAVAVGERAHFQRSNCVTLVERLKRLQPLLDEVRDSKMLVSGAKFEPVADAVVAATQLLERCGPHGSKVYMVGFFFFLFSCGFGGLGFWAWSCYQSVAIFGRERC